MSSKLQCYMAGSLFYIKNEQGNSWVASFPGFHVVDVDVPSVTRAREAFGTPGYVMRDYKRFHIFSKGMAYNVVLVSDDVSPCALQLSHYDTKDCYSDQYVLGSVLVIQFLDAVLAFTRGEPFGTLVLEDDGEYVKGVLYRNRFSLKLPATEFHQLLRRVDRFKALVEARPADVPAQECAEAALRWQVIPVLTFLLHSEHTRHRIHLRSLLEKALAPCPLLGIAALLGAADSWDTELTASCKTVLHAAGCYDYDH